MNPFSQVLSALTIAQVRFILVGGFAGVLYGLNRFTADCDLVIELEKLNIQKAVKALTELGLSPRLPVDPMLFADDSIRANWITERNLMVFSFIDSKNPLFAVDIFAEHPFDFESVYKLAPEFKVLNHLVKVCPIEELIRMKKLAGRSQDLLDIAELTQLRERKNRK